jgi:hypothetical protein
MAENGGFQPEGMADLGQIRGTASFEKKDEDKVRPARA